MAFWDKVKKAASWLNPFDNDDEERRKREQSQNEWRAPEKAPVQSGGNAFAGTPWGNQNQPEQPQQQQPNNRVNLFMPGSQGQDLFGQTLEKAIPDTRSEAQKAGQRKIDEMRAQELPRAVEEEKKRTGWFDRTFTDRDWEKRAETQATNRAVRRYQDEAGYNKQPEVESTLRINSQNARQLSENAAEDVEKLNKVRKAVDKAGQVAQYVPFTGSVLNLGLAGTEKLAKVTGNKALEKDTRESRNRVDFGMSSDEFNQLDKNNQGKLNIIRNLGLAAAPLDLLGFGGLAKAQGVSTAKRAATQLVKEGAVDEATKAALKQGVRQTSKELALPTAAGTGLSLGAQQYLTGDMDLVEAAKNGLLIGGTSLLFPGRNLRKATDLQDAARDIPNTGAVTPAVDSAEVAPGVKSTNPNREADAAAQNAEEAAKQAEAARMAQEAEAPTPQRTAAPGAASEPTTTPARAEAPTPEVAPTLETAPHLRSITQGAEPKAATPVVPQAATPPRTPITAENTAQMLEAQRPQVAREAVEGTELAPKVETPIEPPQPVAAALQPSRVDEAPIETSGEPTIAELAAGDRPANDIQKAIEDAHNAGDDATVSQLIEQLPEDMKAPMRSALGIEEPTIPTMAASSGQMVEAAPRSHDALVRQLGPVGKELKGKYSERAAVNLDELKQNATGVIASMSDDDVVRAFASAGPDTMIRDSNSFAVARAALERLSQMPDDPAAVQTVTNIMDAMDRYVSKSGQGLRIAQEEFDNMPLPMKVRYIIKKIDGANAEQKNYSPLADDPAKAQVVEANITGYLKGSQAINERIAGIQNQLNDVADAARNGEKTDVNVKSLVRTLKTEQRNLAANNGELVKYYQDLMPKRSRGNRANDFARRMMLASFTGRINDLITTTANIANLGVTNVTQGLLAKAVNLVRPGTVSDTSKGVGRLFTGAAEGLRKVGGEVRGEQYAPDLERALSQGNLDMRSGLQRTRGPVGRTIQAATEAATQLSQGVRDQRLYQLADQEAAQAGLKGAMRRQYAEARAAVPSRQMLDAADRLHMEVNNLNENPVSRTLNRVSAAIEGKSAVGGFLKNQIMPFTSWLGGNIYNTITDKNVVATFVKTLDSVRKGDPEGIVRNLSKTANNAAATYALGYLLTQAGVITNENAEGYNDAGAYFHIGDRYIPAGFLGFFAPSVILGNAAYNGLNNPEAGSPSEAIASAAGDALLNMAKSINVAGALGVESNLSRSYEELTKPGGGAENATATGAAGAAGQFIPALQGDINAVLNNGLNVGGMQIIPDTLNPTHEKADTRVTETNPETGRERKDVPKSALAGLQNRIPGLSQQLPRKAGVAAPDLVDRTTRGDRDTQAGKQARAEEKAKVDRKADFEARGIPNPDEKNFDDTVKARTEEGNYAAAIEGLQAKLSNNQKNKDIPKSKSEEIEKQIKTLKVTKDGGYEPKVIELYKKTSLTEWRNMGDPESEDYNPELYKLLYNYDNDLAKEGVSRSSKSGSDTLYSVKKSKAKSGSGGGSRNSAESRELAKIRSNKISEAPVLPKIDFGDLAPQKAGSVKMPTIQQLKAGELVKKRKISVSRG